MESASDIAVALRAELQRVRPSLGAEDVEQLIADIPQCFRAITDDNASTGVAAWHDFFNFSLVDGVALATIYRESRLEVFAFLADETLIHSTDHLALTDVDEFLQAARGRFRVPEVGLVIPMSEAGPWLELGDR